MTPGVTARLRGALPRPARRALRSAARLPGNARLASDLASLRALDRLERGALYRDVRAAELERIRLRPLGGRPVWLRPRSSDAWVLHDVFARDAVHRPPPPVGPEARTIWDLGSNVGLTIADMAVRHPRARIIGVELDERNLAIARRNVAAWPDRCQVLHGAVWFEEGTVAYEPEAEELGFVASAPGSRPGERTVPALSLDGLFARHTPEGPIDYVKMDVEGAERDILRRNTGWAARVGAIRVEIHGGYGLDECAADLAALGFRTEIRRAEHGPVTGVRQLAD